MSFASPFPLLGTFVERLGVGALGGGVLIALPSLTLCLVTIPGAGLVYRLGTQRMMVIGVALSAITTATFPLIPGLPIALANRAAFGLAMGITWVAGSAWLSRLEERRSTRSGVSALVVALGLGLAVGPPLAGMLAGAWGLSAPFLLLGAVQAACVLLFASLDEEEASRQAGEMKSLGGVRAATHDPRIVLAASGLFVSGLIGTGSNVLAGLDLREAGLSEAATGWVLAIGVGIYLLTSVMASNSGPRVVGTTLLAAAIVAQPVSFTPAAIDPTVSSIAVTLFLAGLTRGFVSTVALPYSEAAGHDARIASATAFGFVLAVWASSAVVGPLAAGGLSQIAGSRAWLFMEVGALIGLALVSTYARRLRRGVRVACESIEAQAGP